MCKYFKINLSQFKFTSTINITRWGTWFKAASYYVEYFNEVKCVINTFYQNKAKCIENACSLFILLKMSSTLLQHVQRLIETLKNYRNLILL